MSAEVGSLTQQSLFRYPKDNLGGSAGSGAEEWASVRMPA